jgi:hypothetical protein
MSSAVGDAAIDVVRRNAEEVQSKGNFKLFEDLFDADFVDHTPQPDKDGVRVLYHGLATPAVDTPWPSTHSPRAAGQTLITTRDSETARWSVGNLLKVMIQLGVFTL